MGQVTTMPRSAAAEDLTFVESLSTFFARVSDAVPPMLITDLLPGDGTVMMNGDARALKTWCLLEEFLALGTQTPAFGLCHVPAAVAACYITNEDGAVRVKQRLTALMAGRGLERAPDHLHLAVHRGVWLDDEVWQSRVILAAQKYGYRWICLDPLRSLTGAVDQGPREVQPFMTFCRLLAKEASCVVNVAHHDTKPPSQGRDERKRSHRASGGGLISHIDAPVQAARLNESPAATLLTPYDWKHLECPPSIEVSLTVKDGSARLVGRHTTAEEAQSLAVHEHVLSYLRSHPDVSGSKVAQGARLAKHTVLHALEQLAERGIVDSRPGRRNATHWFIVNGTSSGSSGSAVVPNHSEGERF